MTARGPGRAAGRTTPGGPTPGRTTPGRTTPGRAAAALLATALLVPVLAGCTHEPPAVSTDDLASRLESIEGVTSADVVYEDDFESGTHHIATVTAQPGADLVCLVDRTLATLHHAVEGTLIVSVTDGERTADPTALGFPVDAVFRNELRERYGPGPEELADEPQRKWADPTCDPLPAAG